MCFRFNKEEESENDGESGLWERNYAAQYTYENSDHFVEDNGGRFECTATKEEFDPVTAYVMMEVNCMYWEWNFLLLK